ncbi:MAG: AtpZ/AtpI family protein [Gemmatimonadota bacterium]
MTRFEDEVRRRAERRAEAEKEKDQSIWFGLGMMGVVGWSVAVPTVLGLAVGIWLDARTTGTVSWTLTGLGVGVILGCLTAWRWIERESRKR